MNANRLRPTPEPLWRDHPGNGHWSCHLDTPGKRSPLTYKAIFSTSLICTRNSTSSTTRPATQKPIAAPRCLSQAAPSPQANRRKGKLIMAQPLQGQPLALADRQLERITKCKVLKFPALTSVKTGSRERKKSRPPSSAASIDFVKRRLSAPFITLAAHAPAPAGAAPPAESRRQCLPRP